jgi:hypothetical protein
MSVNNIPAPGDFSWIADNMTRTSYEDMYAAITKAGAWEDMKADPGEGGYMFGGAAVVDRVSAVLNDRVGHSGASFSWYMRAMQRLARMGWEAWVAEQCVAEQQAAAVAEANRKEKEQRERQRQEDDAVAHACFAACGFSDPSNKCEHGIPAYACMPCSH